MPTYSCVSLADRRRLPYAARPGETTKVVLVGEVLRFRSFNGANKALPVLASSLLNAGFSNVVQLDLERPDVSIADVCRHAIDSDLVAFAGCLTPQWPDLDATAARVYAALLDAGRSHVPIVVGGYATKSVDDIARASPWIAASFDGEGEDGIVQISKAVASGTFAESRREIRGLSFVTRDGVMHKSVAARTTTFEAIDQGWGLVHVPEVHDMDIFRGPDGVRGRPLSCSRSEAARGAAAIATRAPRTASSLG